MWVKFKLNFINKIILSTYIGKNMKFLNTFEEIVPVEVGWLNPGLVGWYTLPIASKDVLCHEQQIGLISSTATGLPFQRIQWTIFSLLFKWVWGCGRSWDPQVSLRGVDLFFGFSCESERIWFVFCGSVSCCHPSAIIMSGFTIKEIGFVEIGGIWTQDQQANTLPITLKVESWR